MKPRRINPNEMVSPELREAVPRLNAALEKNEQEVYRLAHVLCEYAAYIEDSGE